MTEITLRCPAELAERLRPIGNWLPTILELSLVGFRTLAAATAAEIVDFLSQNPEPSSVAAYRPSESSQARLQRLLALNSAGILGADEQQELDELEQIEHIIVQLKIRAHQVLSSQA